MAIPSFRVTWDLGGGPLGGAPLEGDSVSTNLAKEVGRALAGRAVTMWALAGRIFGLERAVAGRMDPSFGVDAEDEGGVGNNTGVFSLL